MAFETIPLSTGVSKEDASLILGALELIGKDEEMNEQFGMLLLGDVEDWNTKADALAAKLKKFAEPISPGS